MRFLFPALIAAAASLPAQSPPAPIPHNVAVALLRSLGESFGTYDRDPVLTVGEISPAFKDRLGVPPRTSMVMTVTWGNSADIIGTSGESADAIRTWYLRDFEKRKYRMANYNMNVPGFREAPPMFRETMVNNSVCDGVLQYAVSTRAAGTETQFRIRITSNFGPCQTQPSYYSYPNSGIDAAMLPTLTNPTVAAVTNRCQATYVQQQTSSNTTYSTDMPAPEIAAHYAKQMETQGWRRETLLPAAVASWTRADSSGRRYRAELAVQPISSMPDCRTLTLRVMALPDLFR